MSQEAKQESDQHGYDQNGTVGGAFLLLANFAGVDNQQIGNSDQYGKPGQDDGDI